MPELADSGHLEANANDSKKDGLLNLFLRPIQYEEGKDDTKAFTFRVLFACCPRPIPASSRISRTTFIV